MKKFLILSVLFMVIGVAYADRLTLSDGSVVIGTIEQKLGGKVTISNGILGTISISEDNIVSMDIDAPMNVALADNQVVTGKISANQDGKVTIEDNNRTLDINEISAMWKIGERDLTLPPPREWNGEFYANMIAKSGNTRKFNGGIGAKAALAGPDDKFSAGIYGERERDNHQTTTKKYSGNMDYEHVLSGMSNWYVKLEGEKNEIDDIDYRLASTAGIGHYFIKEADFQIRLRAGLGYQQKKFESTSKKDDSMIAEVNLHLEKKFEGYGSLVTDINYLPSLDDIHDYRIVHETSFDIPLAFRTPMSLRMGIKHEYDSKTSRDIKRLDTTYFANIVYRW